MHGQSKGDARRTRAAPSATLLVFLAAAARTRRIAGSDFPSYDNDLRIVLSRNGALDTDTVMPVN